MKETWPEKFSDDKFWTVKDGNDTFMKRSTNIIIIIIIIQEVCECYYNTKKRYGSEQVPLIFQNIPRSTPDDVANRDSLISSHHFLPLILKYLNQNTRTNLYSVD